MAIPESVSQGINQRVPGHAYGRPGVAIEIRPLTSPGYAVGIQIH